MIEEFEAAVQRRLEEIKRQPWLEDMQKSKMRELILNRLRTGEPLSEKQTAWLVDLLENKKFPDDERPNAFGRKVLYIQQLNACNGEGLHRHRGDDKADDQVLCATEVVSEALSRVGIFVTPERLEEVFKEERTKLNSYRGSTWPSSTPMT